MFGGGLVEICFGVLVCFNGPPAGHVVKLSFLILSSGLNWCAAFIFQ